MDGQLTAKTLKIISLENLYVCIRYKCDTKVKATAYATLVRPILEYATLASMGPISTIHKEMVQQRAARWVKQEYGITTSVTSILNNLK